MCFMYWLLIAIYTFAALAQSVVAGDELVCAAAAVPWLACNVPSQAAGQRDGRLRGNRPARWPFARQPAARWPVAWQRAAAHPPLASFPNLAKVTQGERPFALCQAIEAFKHSQFARDTDSPKVTPQGVLEAGERCIG